MKKTEVYSWRISPALKMAIEEAAREEGVSIAEFLDRAARDRVEGSARGGRRAHEAQRQHRLRSSAMRFVGAIAGGDPRRAERTRELLRARLKRRHER